MLKQIRTLGVLAGALAIASSYAASEPGGAALSASVQATVRRHIDAGDIPGMVTLVARDGRIEYLEAQGVLDAQQTPLHKDTVFWVASLTKPVVATSVLMLLDEGKLQLDDPVSKFIPEFQASAMVRTLKPGSPPPQPSMPGKAPDPKLPKPQYDLAPATRSITLKDLLTHTSGLQTIGVPNEAIPDPAPGDTLASWVPKLAKAPLDFQPGSQWAYSNATGFDVLARVVEVVSGTTFDKFVQQRIFAPLNMNDSSFGPRADLVSRTMPLPAMFAAAPCVVGKTFFCGSAGLWTTAENYFRLAEMLRNKGVVPNGKRVLTARSVDLMTSNQVGSLFSANRGPIQGAGLGFGLSVQAVLDANTAKLAVPNGSYGWDGIGLRRFWVIPPYNAVLIMMLPSGTAPPVHRDVEQAVIGAFKK
jgi:CubicO group peptidase (beta-lactamase class C family)